MYDRQSDIGQNQKGRSQYLAHLKQVLVDSGHFETRSSCTEVINILRAGSSGVEAGTQERACPRDPS